MCVSCGRGKEDEDLMFKCIFRKEILCLGRVSFRSCHAQEEVFSSLAKGDLPAKVDYIPSSLGSSPMTILFKTHAQAFSSCILITFHQEYSFDICTQKSSGISVKTCACF